MSLTGLKEASLFEVIQASPLYVPRNHLESCLTVRRAGLSPRLRYITASMARKSVTVAVNRLPSTGTRKSWMDDSR